MKTVTLHTNKVGDIWMKVPLAGLFPLLLLEAMANHETFHMVESLDHRAYDEDEYGLDKFIQVNFKKLAVKARISDLIDFLNTNAGVS